MTDKNKQLLAAKVSAIIPTFNGVKLLRQYLAADLACLRAGDELIIVDDASTDQTLNWCQDYFNLEQDETVLHPEYQVWRGKKKSVAIILVVNQKNLGFGESCNRGVLFATGSYLLLLNSDVKPQATILKYLLPHFADPEMFAVGCLEYEVKPGADITKNTPLGGKNVLWFGRGIYLHRRASEFTTGPAAWASGGSALFDAAKWQELGGFDPLYSPAYWEDIDLSTRAKQKGWQIMFEAKAVVEHRHETTTQTAFGQKKIKALSWRNIRRFTWRHTSPWQKLLFLLWLPYHSWKLRLLPFV
jgi:GT2 family glycosyltransferase